MACNCRGSERPTYRVSFSNGQTKVVRSEYEAIQQVAHDPGATYTQVTKEGA